MPDAKPRLADHFTSVAHAWEVFRAILEVTPPEAELRFIQANFLAGVMAGISLWTRAERDNTNDPWTRGRRRIDLSQECLRLSESIASDPEE